MATIPSISLIPSGYKAGKVYSVLPTDGSADFDFSRNTTATRINKDGLIENVGNNVPRLDYEGGGCPSLLLEPQRTNLILNSQAISLTTVKSGTYTDNFAISPDGTQNATKLTATNSDPYFYQDLSFSSASYTTSIYVKGIGNSIGKDFQIRLAGNIYTVVIPLEWTRFQYTVTTPSGVASVGLEIPNPAVTGDEVLVWGWQLEQSSYATSYIPTSGSAQTRLAETANGAGNAATFNDSEGVLMVETSFVNDISYKGISVSSGANGNSIRIYSSLVDNQLVFRVTVNSVDQVLKLYTLSDTSLFNKISIKYKENDFNVFINGFKILTDNIGSTFSSGILNQLNFDRSDGNDDFYGNTKQIQYYNTALTDLELEKITSYTSFNAMALAQNYTI